MKPNKKKVGERIRKIRTDLGYSMDEFGQLLGDSPRSSVNNWEKGISIPKEDKLQKIALLGNTFPEKILYGDGKEYLFDLIDTNLGVQFSDEILWEIFNVVPEEKRSYTDDVMWLSVAKYFLENGKSGRTAGYLEYDSVAGIENLYTAQYKNEFIQQSKGFGQFSIVYYAFADIIQNTLHLIPFTTLNSENKEEFFKDAVSLEKQNEHEYITKNFEQINLELDNSKIIFYMIDKETLNEAVSAFSYNADANNYSKIDLADVKLFPSFQSQIQSEIAKLRKKSLPL